MVEEIQSDVAQLECSVSILKNQVKKSISLEMSFSLTDCKLSHEQGWETTIKEVKSSSLINESQRGFI